MSSSYFAPLVTLPTIVTAPGTYRARGGAIVTITTISARHDFGCLGTYADGVRDGWHRSGRLYATSESQNDIVSRN